MGKGISVIAGRASGPDGAEVPIFRALRLLFCSSCGGVIGEGEHFTRRALAGGPGLAAQCRKCVPFEMRPGGNERRVSGLLASLLSPESPVTAPPTEGGTDVARESMLKRLGPALRRHSDKK